ncbi:MAG: urease accessory protein UreE [Gammaproteobacteria bacterium]|nr:urease accessory protein UreE [Gammaproteobacteria bacterium]
MREINLVCEKKQTAAFTLTLPFELRQKSRFKTVLDDGSDVAVILPRGNLLRGGDCLKTNTGEIVEVIAADETVSTVYSHSPLELARASYHLGNRHVSLQISESWIRYQHDHVLDEMINGLGLDVMVEKAAFEPEAGAYGGGHRHGDQQHEH